jgi:hypothetical protein
MLPTFLEDLKSEYQAYSVLEQNDDHKGEQYRKTDGVDHTLNLGRDFLACHHLDENGNEPSAVKRGDMTGMSFMFVVDKDSWDDIESDYPKRTVEHISRVLEVSAVAFPAYPQTSIQVASEGDALDSAKASLESARKQLAEDRERQAEAERRTAALERLNNLITEVSAHE